ncbi:hypothetical protein BG003_008436 [Podila horticola]|nr:hypothetical protein BG003_008436 [Podila horticola]
MTNTPTSTTLGGSSQAPSPTSRLSKKRGMSMDEVKREPEVTEDRRQQEPTARKRQRSSYSVRAEKKEPPTVNFTPLIANMANVDIHGLASTHRDVNFETIIADLANIHIQDLPPNLATTHSVSSGGGDDGINSLVADMSKVRLQELVEWKPRVFGRRFLDRVLAKLSVDEQTTESPETGSTMEELQQQPATGMNQQSRIWIEFSIPKVGKALKHSLQCGTCPFETVEELVDYSFRMSNTMLMKYISEDENYYMSQLDKLPMDAINEKLRAAYSWFDQRLLRNWLNKKNAAYLEATNGRDRAAIRKEVWMMISDQVRGVLHLRHQLEMEEEALGPAGQEADADMSGKDPVAIELWSRIKVLKESRKTETSPTRDQAIDRRERRRIRVEADAERDQRRAKEEAGLRAFMAERIKRSGLQSSNDRITMYQASCLIENLEIGRLHVRMRTLMSAHPLINWKYPSSGWADNMDHHYVTVEAYLAEMENTVSDPVGASTQL